MIEKNLATFFQNRRFRFGPDPFLAQKTEKGWKWLTWNDLGQAVEEIGRALLSIGIQSGDKVGIFSENSLEWVMADLAVLSVGGITVPIYSSTVHSQVQFILSHSEMKCLFIGNEEQFHRVTKGSPSFPNLQTLISIDFNPPNSAPMKTLPFSDFQKMAKEVSSKSFYDRLGKINPQDISSLIYTSGTTGVPKGVMLSHENILSNVYSCLSVVPLQKDDLSLSFLPLSHAFERTCGFFAMMSVGGKIAFAENIHKVEENLLEMKPSILLCVPRILEKIYEALRVKICEKPQIIQKFLLKGIDLSQPKNSWGLETKRKLFDSFIYKKLREHLGNRVRFIISGGAALNPNLGRFFEMAGLPVLEGYGLTETSPVVCINPPGKAKFGTVGKVIPEVQMKMSNDQEILVKGPNVMKGYFKDPEATREAIDVEGFFHTGDIGKLDSDFFLSITDRKKDFIVTAAGKNIPPQPIERELVSHPLIDQACVMGEGKKFLSVLLVPNWNALFQKARSQNVSLEEKASIIAHPMVRSWYQEIIDQINNQYSSHETLKRFELLSEDFTVANESLTTTYKMKRKTIADRYRSLVEKMYEAS